MNLEVFILVFVLIVFPDLVHFEEIHELVLLNASVAIFVQKMENPVEFLLTHLVRVPSRVQVVQLLKHFISFLLVQVTLLVFVHLLKFAVQVVGSLVDELVQLLVVSSLVVRVKDGEKQIHEQVEP